MGSAAAMKRAVATSRAILFVLVAGAVIYGLLAAVFACVTAAEAPPARRPTPYLDCTRPFYDENGDRVRLCYEREEE